MVGLSIPPLPRRQYLSDDAALPPLLIHLVCDISGLLLLLLIMVEDAAPVLRPNVWALAIRRGRVVHLVEELEDGAVRQLLGVVNDL